MIDELDLIDLTIKKFVEPQLHLDSDLLLSERTRIIQEKQAMLDQIGTTKEHLMSDAKFLELLKAKGLRDDQIPKKWSAAQGKHVPTFAKISADFNALRSDPRFKPYVEARLAHKSTLEESRIDRLLRIGPILNVPLMYYAAHPGRFGGAGMINLQNIPRGSIIRRAIHAPRDHLCVVADLSQIEARITATLAGQWDLVNQFANNEDVYSAFATELYRRPITKDANPRERFIGKTGILSFGYKSSGLKFFTTMTDVFKVPITQEEAFKAVRVYRNRYREIVRLWETMDTMLSKMALGDSATLGPLRFEKDRMILPNGMPVHYHNLTYSSYFNGKKTESIYGSKLLQNAVSGLARIVMTTAELRLARHKLRAALSVHDELVFVVKAKNANLVAGVVKSVMEEPVKWMPRLPVAVEVGIGQTYGDAK